MIDESDWARVARHLAGEESPAESEATRRWLAESPERRAIVDGLTNAWSAAATPANNWDSTAAWQRLVARRRRSEQLRAAKPASGPPVLRWGAVAAAILVVAAGAALVVRRSPVVSSAHSDAASREQEYRTAPGQRAVVNLVDGTRVELGVESALRVREWSGPTREVFLSGEAAFTVVHDTARRFVVHSRNAVVEDLGTRFALRAYPDEPRVRVAVTSGEISLADSARTVREVLGAGDEAALDSIGRVAVKHHSDTTAMLAWTHDRFVVEATPLRDVARQLERWFDVRIELRDSAAASSRVTINMPATRLTDILGAATTPLGLVYSHDGRTVVIRRPASQEPPVTAIPRRSEP